MKFNPLRRMCWQGTSLENIWISHPSFLTLTNKSGMTNLRVAGILAVAVAPFYRNCHSILHIEPEAVSPAPYTEPHHDWQDVNFNWLPSDPASMVLQFLMALIVSLVSVVTPRPSAIPVGSFNFRRMRHTLWFRPIISLLFRSCAISLGAGRKACKLYFLHPLYCHYSSAEEML